MSKEKQPYDLIVGLGRSGLSMARFLASQGRRVIVTDIDPGRSDQARALEADGIETQVGFHDQAVFDNAAGIIPSPGIPLTIPYIQRALEKGVKITGELDIFSQYCTDPVIAVTGTNGKTTTTTLIGEMLRACGISCFVGGNIGTPLVDYLMGEQKADWIVAEVSSYQLDLARSFAPAIGLLLNISEDHLDRYPDYRAYRESKWSLFSNQSPKDLAVINPHIQGAKTISASLNAKVAFFSSNEAHTPDAMITAQGIELTRKKGNHTIPATALAALPGNHNKENVAAAALAVINAGGSLEGICTALEQFSQLPHRTAFVREVDGVRFYNDSKATNVDAVVRALESFNAELFLILGGREKDTDFTPLIAAVKPGVKQILAIGEATDHILKTFETVCRVVPCKTMADAVASAHEAAGPGDIVLLSPACASFDMYLNYEERGNDFVRSVKDLTPKKEAAHG